MDWLMALSRESHSGLRMVPAMASSSEGYSELEWGVETACWLVAAWWAEMWAVSTVCQWAERTAATKAVYLVSSLDLLVVPLADSRGALSGATRVGSTAWRSEP